ncbi:MAG: hypothetical protein ACAI25_03925 [Planctomycetota bacterium]
MKRSLALLLPALVVVVAAAVVRADDKQPAANTAVIGVTAKQKDKLRKWQVPQYCLVTTFAQWGFKVESRVSTAWDAKLPKDSIKVVVPAKEGDKAAPAGPAAFTIEGTIDYVKKDVKFYDNAVDVLVYVADVNVVVKDAAGKELKKISWQNYYGNNTDVGEEAVIKESEERATRFLTVDLFSIKEIVDQIPKEKKEDFEKFLAKEKEVREKNFDDYSKHKTDEKKDGDEKK